ncbi:hypothetical protein [Fulvitalea axinellae]
MIKKATEEVKGWASKNGFEFLSKKESAEKTGFSRTRFYRNHKAGKCHDVISKKSGGSELRVLTYRYRQGNHSGRITAFGLHSGWLRKFPDFLVKPEGFLNAVGEFFGSQDIDFSEHPEFSERYVLKGDEVKLRVAFNKEVLDFFYNVNDALVYEKIDDSLYLYRTRSHDGIEEYSGRLKTLASVASILKKSMEARDSVQ